MRIFTDVAPSAVSLGHDSFTLLHTGRTPPAMRRAAPSTSRQRWIRASAIIPFSECFWMWQCTIIRPRNGATKRIV